MKRTTTKNRINTTVEQHEELLKVAKMVRGGIKKYIGDYCRVYTEPRKNGIRTKFFAARNVNFMSLEKSVLLFSECGLDGKYDIKVKADGFPRWGDIFIYIKFKK